jgi:hypothetical protein
MQINISSNARALTARLTAIEKRQLPFAVAMALNATAKDVQTGITTTLPDVFDRPAPFTMNALAVLPAGKTAPVATVLVKDQQAKYLRFEQFGGTRTAAANSIKPATALALPSGSLPLDSYGGMRRGQLAKLKEAAKQNASARQDWRAARKAARDGQAPRSRAKGALATRRTGPPAWPRDFGIFYWRHPTGKFADIGGYFIRSPGHYLKRLSAFLAETHYKPRMDFFGRGMRLARGSFERHLREELRKAVATAKP